MQCIVDQVYQYLVQLNRVSQDKYLPRRRVQAYLGAHHDACCAHDRDNIGVEHDAVRPGIG